ncbi:MULTISPECIES: C4-dicarboxylate transporter DcuC [Corynebacterium]|uniref:C4-dicarboxylate transporter, DcuC family n=1 Tax=Corynebacterium timonense TaxID=441500 RepID=A0A1H1UMH7_9CORY|nr:MULTISPECIES: C4-dicarboxylate transporter DcuC [Corynebacterium]WJY69093.1 Putative cryptic C4-dicarboxylate transporter DcuD [Corynebacterium auris]SDS73744.1 C4-dicarboxylate transporter, DcuC family [Corynebacterium timonense]
MVYIAIAIAAIIAVGYFIYKRVHAASAIFAVGVLLLMIAAATGRVDHTELDIEFTGNAFYDELLVVEELFKSRFAGTGMAIMVLFGFVGYMRHIGADAKTVVALSRPLQRFNGSYWLVPLGFTVGTLLSLVVPSASALSLLLVATLLPALIAAGLSPLTVGAIIVTSSTIVPTPLEAGLIQGADLVGMSVTEFTFGNVAKATIPALVVMAFAHMWWQWRCDKKDAARETLDSDVTTSPADSDDRVAEAMKRAEGLPGFYAILPLLPLVLIIISAILNRAGVVEFEADILPVTVVSLMITMIIEAIRHRTVSEALDDLSHFFRGLGEGAGSVVALIVAAAILVEGITQMGVIEALTSLAGDSSGAAVVIVLIFVAATALMAMLTGSGVAPYFAFSEMVPGLAANSTIHAPQMLASIWATSNTMRQASPVNAAVLIVSGALGVNPIELVRRTIVPMFAGAAVAVLCAFLFI